LIHDQLTYQSPGLLPSLLLGAGLVGTSRLVMQAHSLAQVAAGYLVGAIGVAAGVFML
jgi:membrane-associated phospholipid phosphatase